MSSHNPAAKRLSVLDIRARKGQTPLVCLTAYSAPMAAILEQHCDILLVGDSVGMVYHGLPDTIGVSLEMMTMHARAVMRGSSKAFVVVDMPFGSYEAGPEQAFMNAAQLLKDTGAHAVKLESGPYMAGTIRFLADRGIAVMGHVGLRPQAILAEGGFRAKGRTAEERKKVLAEAQDTDAAGAFAIVVEGVAADLSGEITAAVKAPTIGIGASSACDGQILVTDDMLGLFDWTPKFVRHYADLRGTIDRAIAGYAQDVRSRSFPAAQETYFSK